MFKTLQEVMDDELMTDDEREAFYVFLSEDDEERFKRYNAKSNPDISATGMDAYLIGIEDADDMMGEFSDYLDELADNAGSILDDEEFEDPEGDEFFRLADDLARVNELMENHQIGEVEVQVTIDVDLRGVLLSDASADLIQELVDAADQRLTNDINDVIQLAARTGLAAPTEL